MDAANLSPFKLMVTIVDRSKAEQVIEVCCDLSLPYHVAILGEGTATGEILDYFGLASTDKAVVLSLVCSSSLSAVRAALRNELRRARHVNRVRRPRSPACKSLTSIGLLP